MWLLSVNDDDNNDDDGDDGDSILTNAASLGDLPQRLLLGLQLLVNLVRILQKFNASVCDCVQMLPPVAAQCPASPPPSSSARSNAASLPGQQTFFKLAFTHMQIRPLVAWCLCFAMLSRHFL